MVVKEREIIVNTVPQNVGSQMLYSWVVLERNGEEWGNVGHGWASSIEEAFNDGNDYYKNVLDA